MFVVKDHIHVNAPLDRCFLLATNLDLVRHTLRMSVSADESTRAAGMVAQGDRLVWRGKVFGWEHLHESLITRYERPYFFQDTMARGRFRRFQHDHTFTEIGGRTLLSDKVQFSMPMGWAGRMVGRYVVMPHVSRLLRLRLELLKRLAESDGWRDYIATEG